MAAVAHRRDGAVALQIRCRGPGDLPALFAPRPEPRPFKNTGVEGEGGRPEVAGGQTRGSTGGPDAEGGGKRAEPGYGTGQCCSESQECGAPDPPDLPRRRGPRAGNRGHAGDQLLECGVTLDRREDARPFAQPPSCGPPTGTAKRSWRHSNVRRTGQKIGGHGLFQCLRGPGWIGAAGAVADRIPGSCLSQLFLAVGHQARRYAVMGYQGPRRFFRIPVAEHQASSGFHG